MNAHRILQLNAVFTSAGAAGIFVTRGTLYTLFGLDGPALLDVIGAGLFAYAAALLVAAARPPVSRQTLMTFTAADALWVVASAIVLLLFWSALAPVARFLIITVAIVVEVFAALQFRAAGRAVRSPQAA